jgi:hypothetical protein
VSVEVRLEVPVEVLYRLMAQPMQDPPHLHHTIGVRIRLSLRSDQKPPFFQTSLAHIGSICWVSPSTNRASLGNSSINSGVTSLSAMLARVSWAGKGLYTEPSGVTTADCSFILTHRASVFAMLGLDGLYYLPGWVFKVRIIP